MVAGTVTWPPVMYRYLASWFAIWSKHTPAKSANISSATGLSPRIDAPIAAPMIACSEIGVSSTRSPPNSSISPAVSLKAPPAAAMSSPSRNTLASAARASAMPSLTASR